MVFQKPNPFPKSIYDNVAYGPRINGIRGKSQLNDIVEHSLRQAALWDEVKNRLGHSGLGLSGGQAQRLCIARTLAVEPDVVLMDEPASALDPIATGAIEDLMKEIKDKYTIVIVTHNMQQATRVSDRTAFFSVLVDSKNDIRTGTLVEYEPTDSCSATRRTIAPRPTSPAGWAESRAGQAGPATPRRTPPAADPARKTTRRAMVTAWSPRRS